ncbi:hypothetical protein BC332_09731 [Capsicum chinense]|uniref:Xaa-Pro dipeptidyl-peptidase-like domain-containing protein n=1 Tax=Capsicum annuum TaxID=4072 RepID=A0A1U8G2K5_CAPAN|nr:uncharacterized protein LOC107863747 [Capsicum annuum]KAF3640811.1 hypothetical protein FXO37_23315 [Capsicum annuum]KAF3641019.1 hypothetical protein FXO38_21832 [Capsicum annuum]PHT86643.1 hypothetical protein T459_08749 [Capsicum annuum]PHU24624.1 hypothetical protein BC332_09731 [Capsicum chinense]
MAEENGTHSRSTCTIESTDGVTLDGRVYRPTSENNSTVIAVLVHPYSVLGGCQGLMRGIARALSSRGVIAVTFDTRGAGKSNGCASLTGSAEINDVISVCKWVQTTFSTNRIILIGSSAGAAIAGSAVDQVEQVVGYVGLGYPFGFTVSILFGRHQKSILQSPKPKLFVMGTNDGFTSVRQLENKLKDAAGDNTTHLIQGASHFQMEGPAFDGGMVNLILQFITTL